MKDRQGTAVVLSAAVAIVGYFVQSILKSREEESRLIRNREEIINQKKLERIRLKLETFVQPAATLTSIFFQQYSQIFGPEKLSPGFEVLVETKAISEALAGNENEGNYALTMDSITNGGVTRFFKALDIDCTDRRSFNLIPSFVGSEIEEHIRNDPESEIGRLYIDSCKILILNSGKKLSELIEKYTFTYIELIDLDHYLQEYALIKKATGRRMTTLLQFVRFIQEFEFLINNYWEKGDYRTLFPKSNKFPTMMQMYMNKMLNSLQQQESDLDTREAADVALNVARFRSAL